MIERAFRTRHKGVTRTEPFKPDRERLLPDIEGLNGPTNGQPVI